MYFYPRHPRGWRQLIEENAAAGVTFLSTPPSRVATRWSRTGYKPKTISIHATLAGGDLVSARHSCASFPFLSTPPSRVATATVRSTHSRQKYFYPRHPRGWRPWPAVWVLQLIAFLSTPPSRVATVLQSALDILTDISIHATLAGGDPGNTELLNEKQNFYPRHPRGWRLELLVQRQARLCISIHATLAGGDGKSVQKCTVSFAQKGKKYL